MNIEVKDLYTSTALTGYTGEPNMPNITLSVSEELKKSLDLMPEVNWSESMREFLTKRAKRLLLLKKIDGILENSEFTEEDADRLGELVKQSRLKELKSKGLL